MSDNPIRLNPIFTWRGAISSPESYLPAMVRHVAMTLSLHMAEKGRSCFPSVKMLAEECGRNRRSVQRALRRLEADGWLTVRRTEGGRYRSGHFKTNTYTATIPVRFPQPYPYQRLDADDL